MKLHLKDVKHDPRKTLENPHIKFTSNKISEKKLPSNFIVTLFDRFQTIP